MRIVYLASPVMSVPPLLALRVAGHEVVLVVSNPDRRRGRGSGTTPTPVKAAAVNAGIPVTADPDDVLGVQADLGVVVAYGRIIKPHVLAHLPMVNLHFSLLPRWRGAAPVERAILAGDDRTGVCVMAVEEGLDTGGVYARAEVAITPTTTADDLRTELAGLGSQLLVDTLAHPLGTPEPQSADGVTYADKLSAADLELVWDRPALELSRRVRVGGAWTTFRGRRIKVLRADVRADLTAADLTAPEQAAPDTAAAAAATHPALPGSLVGDTVACVTGGLQLLEVQPEGRAPMPFADWANGARPTAADRFGT